MNVRLMYPDRDFDMKAEPPDHTTVLSADLELPILFDAMANGDDFVREVVAQGLLISTNDTETILHRQKVLSDCLANPSLIRDTYDLVVRSIEEERQARWWGFGGRSPSTILSGAVKIMEYYVGALGRLRNWADDLAGQFQSDGLGSLVSTLQNELGKDYLSSVEQHLKHLEFRHGVLVGARLGDGNKGVDYVVRKGTTERRSWLERVFSKQPESYSYTVPDRDEAGARALAELRDRGLNSVANALAQSVDHIRGFLSVLRTELAFFVGCLNLSDRLSEIGEPIAVPELCVPNTKEGTFEELYDVCLALTTGEAVVGNTTSADGKGLVVITGANQGGKSTFLRSVGLAQVMMRAGLFVGARSYRGSVYNAVFTHFKRNEDPSMESGKFDEELARMSSIIDELSPASLVLLNEPFAATNEREGSEIARQVVRALVESGVVVFVVTHLYDFARSFNERPPVESLFLRAERDENGNRSFKLVPGRPLETSYGSDLYDEVFGDLGAARETHSRDR